MVPDAEGNLALLGTVASIVGSIAISSFTLAWKFSKEFTVVKDFVTTKMDRLIEKLEYHERHDDQRFGELRDNIWELRLALKTDKLDKLLIKNDEQENGKYH